MPASASLDLGEVFRRYGPAYQERFGERMPASHRQALHDIAACRTEALGGHVYQCPACEEVVYSYHSCRNRHCPKCQHAATEAWLDKQEQWLLPTSYFLVTFTLPAEMREVARRQQRLVYDLFMRTAAEALQSLAADRRFVGGQIGLVGVLQTWTRDMRYHPHVHFLATGGGLSADGSAWLPGRPHFLVRVEPLAALFRAKFGEALRRTEFYSQAPARVWQQAWVVDCRPVGSGEKALKYLAPYIFRVAISNNRLLSLENGAVTFRYRENDKQGRGQSKTLTLAAEAFIQRFLQHVLPAGFVKVRYYGLLAPGNRGRLARARQLLAATTPVAAADAAAPTGVAAETETEASGHTLLCPQCGRPLLLQQRLPRRSRRPP